MLVCGEEILDASYDDMLLCDSIVTDGAVVILQKMPVTVSLTDKETCFNFYVPQVNCYACKPRHKCIFLISFTYVVKNEYKIVLYIIL